MQTRAQGSRRGVRTDPAARRRIWDLHRKEGLNAAQIFRRLDESGELGDKLPAERTIQHLVRQLAPPADGEWVAAVDGELSEDAPYLLWVLGWVTSFTEGKVQAISLSEARWLASLHRFLEWHPIAMWDLAAGMIEMEKERPNLVTPVLAWLRHSHPNEVPWQVDLDAAAERYGWPKANVQILPAAGPAIDAILAPYAPNGEFEKYLGKEVVDEAQG